MEVGPSRSTVVYNVESLGSKISVLILILCRPHPGELIKPHRNACCSEMQLSSHIWGKATNLGQLNLYRLSALVEPPIRSSKLAQLLTVNWELKWVQQSTHIRRETTQK